MRKKQNIALAFAYISLIPLSIFSAAALRKPIQAYWLSYSIPSDNEETDYSICRELRALYIQAPENFQDVYFRTVDNVITDLRDTSKDTKLSTAFCLEAGLNHQAVCHSDRTALFKSIELLLEYDKIGIEHETQLAFFVDALPNNQERDNLQKFAHILETRVNTFWQRNPCSKLAGAFNRLLYETLYLADIVEDDDLFERLYEEYHLHNEPAEELRRKIWLKKAEYIQASINLAQQNEELMKQCVHCRKV